MFKNYINTALRSLWRNKLLSTINILGLSFGLAICILIFLYTKDEITFDGFHKNKNELYQLTCEIKGSDGETNLYGIAGRPHGITFKEEIPEIKEATRVNETTATIKNGSETFEEKVTWADDNFFEVFSFSLMQGRAEQVLKRPLSIVLTERTAKKYFGSTDVIGKKLQIAQRDVFEEFTVTGLAKDSPQNSSITYNMLATFNDFDKDNQDPGWFMLSYPTFLIMDSKVDLKSIAQKMNAVYQSKADVAKAKKEGLDVSFNWGAQPFLGMHLNEHVKYTPNQGKPIYSYILTMIAFLILLIACINFINLTTAQSIKRSKEIGIRKVIGSKRKQLVIQFLSETALLTFMAFVFGSMMAQVLLPFFNDFANKELSLSYLFDIKLFIVFIALYLLTVLAAGLYPSMVLSGFNPVEALNSKTKFNGRNYFAKALIVVQFCLATFLISISLYMFKQFDYITKMDLGYNPKNLVQISTGKNRDVGFMKLCKNELSKISGVISVAPKMNGDWITSSKANGKEIDVKYEHIDPNFLPTIQATVLEGRNFSNEHPGDSTNSVLVNESFVKQAGWKESAIGKTVDYLNGKNTKLYIVGVVKNYHHESLKQEVDPQLFSTQPHLPFGKFYIRLSPNTHQKVLKEMESLFKELNPYKPFKYDFVEDLVAKEYEADAKWKKVVAFSAILTVFISCLGLFGLTLLTVQKRTKEIGLRKVLGAGVFQILTLLTKNFLALVLVSFSIAVPMAWYAVNKWLQNFAYHVEMSWLTFFIAAILILLFALITLCAQAFSAARNNPVKSLRTE